MAERIGLEAVLDTKNFARGISFYEKSITSIMGDTQKTSRVISSNFTEMSRNTLGFGQIASGVVPMIAGLVGAAGIGAFITSSAQASMQAERLGTATNSLAARFGTSGQEMINAIRSASNNTVSGLEAMRIANLAMLSGVAKSPEQMARLANVGIRLGQAMGLGATVGVERLTEAVAKNETELLDELGLTVRLNDAYRIYADSLGKSVQDLTQAEKSQAFLNAVLIVGEEKVRSLGTAQEDTQAKVERLTAAFTDFKVAFGDLLSTLAGAGSGVGTDLLARLTEGAQAWKYVIDDAIPAIRQFNASLGETAGQALAAAQSQDQVRQAMASGINDIDQLRGGLVNTTASFEDYQKQLGLIISTSAELGGAYDGLISQLSITEEEYTRLRQATANNTEAQRLETEAARLSGQASYYAAGALTEQENATNALAAETARWAGLAEGSKQNLDTMAQGHTLTALEAKVHAEAEKEYAEAQKVAAAAERERIQTAVDLATTIGTYFTGMREAQAGALADEQSFNASLSALRAQAGEEQKGAATSLTESLATIEQDRQEKIQWVLSGAHARTQADNEAALGYWNAHYDQLKTAAETKYTETNGVIQSKLAERESAAAAARQKELSDQQAHLEALKTEAALSVLETTGQLAQFTGGLAISAKQAADLIRAGVLPVSQELGLAIQNTLGQLQQEESTAATVSAQNQSIMQQALAGTLVPLQSQQQLLGTDLPVAAGLSTAAMQLMNQGAQTGLATSTLATQTQDTALQNITGLTLPALQAATLTTTNLISSSMLSTVPSFNSVIGIAATAESALKTLGTTGRSAGDDIAGGMDSAADGIDNLIELIEDAITAFDDMAAAAREAANAAGEAGSASGSSSGVGFAKGLGFARGQGFASGLGLGWTVPPGYPNDSYPMRVESGEQVLITPRGLSIDELIGRRLMTQAPGLGGANITNNWYPVVNTPMDLGMLENAVERVMTRLG